MRSVHLKCFTCRLVESMWLDGGYIGKGSDFGCLYNA